MIVFTLEIIHLNNYYFLLKSEILSEKNKRIKEKNKLVELLSKKNGAEKNFAWPYQLWALDRMFKDKIAAHNNHDQLESRRIRG